MPVNVCPASVLATVAEVLGKVIVVLSVPDNAMELFAVSVLPSAMVKIALVAGVVIVILLIDVALATPKAGVTKVGEVFITNVLPVPVWEATDVALPMEVIGPVKLALVVTVPALPVIFPTIALVTSKSVNQPFNILAPVTPSEPVMVKLFAPKSRLPPETVNPPVALATVIFPVPSKETPPMVRAVSSAVAVPALPEIEPVMVEEKT